MTMACVLSALSNKYLIFESVNLFRKSSKLISRNEIDSVSCFLMHADEFFNQFEIRKQVSMCIWY